MRMAPVHTRDDEGIAGLMPPGSPASEADRGNRVSHSRNPGTGVVTDTYTYPAASNRLSTITLGAGGSRGLTYDAAGNVTGDNRAGQNFTYVYDAAGRMASVSLGGVLQAEYKYDYLGRQFSRKLVPSNTVIHSVFRSDGKRISEYNEGTGALIRHYVWMGDTPVAVIEGGQIYYVRTDWIGRPVFATTSAGTVVWTASWLPFGGVRVTTGTPIDLRFPGQWFQAEAGLRQNRMRDYDPATGRHMQADPLGLVDGADPPRYGWPGTFSSPRRENLAPRPPPPAVRPGFPSPAPSARLPRHAPPARPPARPPEPGGADARGAAIQTVSLTLFRFASPMAKAWVLGQMALARLAFARLPDARFWKLCGSGTGEGFTPRPNTAVWAILAVWPDAATAAARVADAAVYRRWRARAAEDWTVFLSPLSARGLWAGTAPFTPGPDPAPGAPLAALTRATIRPRILLKFWGRVPGISAVIGEDPNVAFKIGIGELPWLQQVTFSIWPDADSMAAFARGDGPHGRAIRAVRAEGWFREELYARFRVAGETGTWGGTSPLARFKDAA